MYLARLTIFKQCWLQMDVIHLPYSITIKSCGQLVWTAKAEGLRKDWAVTLLRWVSEWKVTDSALTSKNGEPSSFITTIYKIKTFNYELSGCNETHIQITYSLPIFFLLPFPYSCVACESTRVLFQEQRSLRFRAHTSGERARGLQRICKGSAPKMRPLLDLFPAHFARQFESQGPHTRATSLMRVCTSQKVLTKERMANGILKYLWNYLIQWTITMTHSALWLQERLKRHPS